MSHIYELNVRTDVRSEHLVELSVSEQYPKSEVPPTDELPDLRTLLVDDDRGLRVMGLQGSEHPRFNEVMRVRENNGDSTLLHPFDSLSTHYLMTCGNQPVGAMTAVPYTSGLIDCELFYPQAFLQMEAERVFSFVKNRVNRFEHTSLRTIRWFARACWQDQASTYGMRWDIINVEVSNRRRFESVGYICLDQFDFVHPFLGTDSRTMLLGADSSRPSWFQPIFQSLSNQVSMEITMTMHGLHHRPSESQQIRSN